MNLAVPAATLALPLAGGARLAQRRLLARCGLLALLLHVWVVLVFGSAPGGSAKPGDGLWGAIQVQLTGLPASGGRQTA